MKKLAYVFLHFSALLFNHVALAQTATGIETDPTLTAVNLAPENPLALLLNNALPLDSGSINNSPFGTWTVKKALISEGPDDAGYLLTCSTYTQLTRVETEAIFKGCHAEPQTEIGQAILTLSFKDLLLKLGGTQVLPFPVPPAPGPHPLPCHTRAC